MSVATGECVAFVDSDDWIAPEMLERLLFAIEKDGSDIAACSVEMVWEDDTPSRMLTVKMDRVLNREEAQTALLKETLLKQPVWYKRSLICDIPFEVGKYHEDVFWSYQAIGRAKKVSLIDYVGYYYTQRSGSIMGEEYSLIRLDALDAIIKRYSYLSQEFPSLEAEARVSILANCIYHYQMALKFLCGWEKIMAFSYIVDKRRCYHYSKKDLKNYKRTQQIWFYLALRSLYFTCVVRNILGIGC